MILDACYWLSDKAHPLGYLPTPAELWTVAQTFDASIFMHHGLYDAAPAESGVGRSARSPEPPYIIPPATLPRLKRLIQLASIWKHGLCLYVSWFYARRAGFTPARFVAAVRDLKAMTGCFNWYVDGLGTPYGDDPGATPEENQWVLAKLRQYAGSNGVVIVHVTQSNGRGGYTGLDWNALRYASLTIDGEGIRLGLDPDFDQEWLSGHLLGGPLDKPFASLAKGHDPAWLVEHGASVIGHAGTKTGADGYPQFTSGLTDQVVAVRRARVAAGRLYG